MILFYSDYCPHCRMLLDTIERHDSQRMIKIVSVEALRAKGQPVPPQITAVPALLLMPSRELMIGKSVFDYLLLPGRGKLLVNIESKTTNSTTVQPVDAQPLEPIAYSIGNAGISDAFSAINDHEHPCSGLDDRGYGWMPLDANGGGASVFADNPFQEETRMKKNLPDVDSIRAQRDLELTQNDINTTQLLPPTATR